MEVLDQEIDSNKEPPQNETINLAEMITVVIWIYQLIKTKLFKKSEIIKTTLSNFAKARTGEEFQSDFCIHQEPVVRFCRDCNSFLDTHCVTFHNEIKFMIQHSVIDFKQIPIDNLHVLDFAPKSFCRNPEHIPAVQWQNKYELLFYCTTCKVLLCQTGRRQHEHHCVVPLDTKCNIKIVRKDLIKLLGANPQTELKPIRDVLTSMNSNVCRQNLVLIIKTLASIEGIEDTTTLYASNLSPNIGVHIDRSNNDTETPHIHTVQPPRHQEDNEIFHEQDTRLTRNGSALQEPSEDNGFTKNADMKKRSLSDDTTTLYSRNMSPNIGGHIDRSNNDTETPHTHTVQPPRQQEDNMIFHEQDTRLTKNGSALQVPCEENGFTKSADMERSSLPDDVQNSKEIFQDLHPTTLS